MAEIQKKSTKQLLLEIEDKCQKYKLGLYLLQNGSITLDEFIKIHEE